MVISEPQCSGIIHKNQFELMLSTEWDYHFPNSYYFLKKKIIVCLLFLVYVETARQNPAATVTMTIGGTTFNRQWRIKVNYIGCWSEMRAPNDCQQYFTGLSGNFMSYGWTAQQVMSQNQEYTNCFRQEIGFCQIDFSISQE